MESEWQDQEVPPELVEEFRREIHARLRPFLDRMERLEAELGTPEVTPARREEIDAELEAMEAELVRHGEAIAADLFAEFSAHPGDVIPFDRLLAAVRSRGLDSDDDPAPAA